MKILLSTLSIAVIAQIASAQSISFFVEKGEVFLEDGSPIRSQDNSVDLRNDSVFAWAGLAQGDLLGTFESGITAFREGSDVVSLNQTLGSISWEAISPASGLLAGVNDFNLANKSGEIGDTPLLLITTSNSFNNLTELDQIGLVGSTTKVVELATRSVNFNGANQWDIEYLGTFGSLTLQAVPEPSSFAALAGVMTLGLVMMRRRRA
ncbi:MAG: PEP-CTERM sorting domain-containing protein [Verrucomicrobia bacterium]|jgi:hypothetical protein|nr:PEP-CTERM sorting domain-containing protein [Verrucomicrobiota bacterium]